LCTRALIRDFISETTLSSRSADCALSSRLVEVSRAVSSCSTTRATIARTAGGAEHFLGLALELRLGQAHRDDRGQPGEDVVLVDLVGSRP
jgi:hypothetical protein